MKCLFHSAIWLCSHEKCVLRLRYLYLHKTKTVVFTILPTIELANYYISKTIITKVSLLGLLFIRHRRHSEGRRRMNNIVK